MKLGSVSLQQLSLRKDMKFKYLQRSKPANVSNFEILADGCFETDWQSYCANRINGFSCGYWLRSEDLISMPLKRINEDNSSYSLEFEKECVSNVSIIKSLPLYFILNLFLFIFISFVFAVNIATIVTMRKLGFIYLPICHYFTYICFFELFDFFIISVDWFISVLTKYEPLLILQLTNASSCQMTHMLFSTCRHIVSAMTIGMAIDLCRFVGGSVYFLAHYRSEWVKNVFILCMVIVCTINCQFFWTFDLNKGENKIIHGRLMSSYLECDFSSTLPLTQLFTKYIWPVSDHLLGEVIPVITSVISAILSSYAIKKKFSLKYPVNLSKVLINAPFVLRLTKCLIGFLILNVVTNFLPRIIYITTKLILQLNLTKPNNIRTSNIVHRHIILNYKSSLNENVDLSFLMGLGNYIKYQLPFNILIRFFYFSVLLKEFRWISFQFLNVYKKIIPLNKNVTDSNMAELLVTNSSFDKELVVIDSSINEEIKGKSLLVEIYC